MPLMFLNGEGMNGGLAHPHIAGSRFVGPRATAARYRFFAFGRDFPGLVPDEKSGASILGELYDVPMDKLARLLAGEPRQLELSIVTLDGGELSFGMVVRADQEMSAGAVDITEFASWRRYIGGANASGDPTDATDATTEG
jgi:gamma-glutamylcyclotransferase (GGCT)/AIG2-like uncharacterized protein YtfP